MDGSEQNMQTCALCIGRMAKASMCVCMIIICIIIYAGEMEEVGCMYDFINMGPSIYDVHKISGFRLPPLSTCVHMGRTPYPPYGRPHAVDMKYTCTALLKRQVQ